MWPGLGTGHRDGGGNRPDCLRDPRLGHVSLAESRTTRSLSWLMRQSYRIHLFLTRTSLHAGRYGGLAREGKPMPVRRLRPSRWGSTALGGPRTRAKTRTKKPRRRSPYRYEYPCPRNPFPRTPTVHGSQKRGRGSPVGWGYPPRAPVPRPRTASRADMSPPEQISAYEPAADAQPPRSGVRRSAFPTRSAVGTTGTGVGVPIGVLVGVFVAVLVGVLVGVLVR